MRLSRNFTVIINYLLDNWLPPAVRDSKLLMFPFFRLLFGRRADDFMSFKHLAPAMSAEKLKAFYEATAALHIHRETDINGSCLTRIAADVVGCRVLDLACGRGFLAGILSRDFRVTAVDMVVAPELSVKYPDVDFQQIELSRLPFADQSFDTVVCAHTLEHIVDIRSAVAELKRVTAQRLIVIVPCQRPYQYTFDLHLHFFPYRWSLLILFADYADCRLSCELVAGDWYLVLDLNQ